MNQINCFAMENTCFIKFSLISLMTIIVLNQMRRYEACSETERTALLELKSVFFISSWVDDPMSDCCDWEGVKCNATTRRVMHLSLHGKRNGSSLLNMSLFHPLEELKSLDLSGNMFQGVYEDKAYNSFGSLKQLNILNLKSNRFNDSILPYLNTLTSLTTLILSWNRIEGSRTKQGLAEFRNLKTLDLGFNSISGSLESQGICGLKNLIELVLNENSFDGQLSECLNNLTSLKFLDISDNLLSGSLSSPFTNLTSLKYLALTGNHFDGIFPLSSLANHSKLEVLLVSSRNNTFQVKTESWHPTYQLKVLQLSSCNLNTDPRFLLNQFHLKFLDLSDNNLYGDFPTWLLNNNTKLEILSLASNSFTRILQLPNTKHNFLQHLDISSNIFTGKLPLNLSVVLQNLIYLDMSKNIFEGDIPSSIGEMTKLRLLDLSRNKFSGELPSQLFMDCVLLVFLDLSNNNFLGQIFPKYMNFPLLRSLYLDNNNFSGKIKDGLLSTTALRVLDISHNMLSGNIPHWIGNFSSTLRVLSMSKNYLEGSIPVQFNKLEVLDISENSLSGSISNFSSVKHLYLQKNALSGLIPSSLFTSSELMTLDLRYNKFSGRISHQINKHSNLRVLLLRGNYLQGHIPNQLCQLEKIGIMDISHNGLNGSIPSCLGNLSFWRVGNDSLYGPEIGEISVLSVAPMVVYSSDAVDNDNDDGDDDRMPPFRTHTVINQRAEVEFATKNRYEFYNGSNLNYMTGLDLSCNGLSGEIPSEIGQLQKIRALNLSNNLLSGAIPESFSSLEMIESLDLSHNKLSGQIPPQLTELNSLSTFNVSYNNLSGPTPDKGQFGTFDESSYRGNLDLCGSLIERKCNSRLPAGEEEEEEEEEDSAIDMVALYWSFGASYATVILGSFALLWINSYWRRLWFYFIDRCIDTCYYWLFKYVFCR